METMMATPESDENAPSNLSPFSAGKTMEKAWGIYVQRFPLFFSFCAVGSLFRIIIIAGPLWWPEYWSRIQRIVQPVDTIAYYVFCYGCTISAVSCILSGKAADFPRTIKTCIQYFWPCSLAYCTYIFGEMILYLAGLVLLGQSIHLVGSLVFLIPMLYIRVLFPIRLYVALPTYIIEKRGFVAAITRSVALTKEQRWKLLGLFIINLTLFFLLSRLCDFLVHDAILQKCLYFAVEPLPRAYFGILMAVTFFELRAAREGPAPNTMARVFD